jgi:2-(1,2-epoxy-1,2-dihydrophenyl)acetyl-CoA isomerase
MSLYDALMSPETETMSFSALRLEIADGIARLTLADAARGNPVDGAMCRELRSAADMIASSPEVRAVLISAEGPVFSYGGDIAAFMEHFDDLPGTIARWVGDLNHAVAKLHAIDAPIVAVVHGICAGGMVGFAAGADIVLATPSAQFVAAYAGIGICCDGGSSFSVSRRVGPARARSFYLLNQTIDAPEALTIGLIDEMIGEEGLESLAEAIVAKFVRGPVRAFGEMKRLLDSAQDHTLEAQLELEAKALVRCMSGAEAREGLRAFAEKRRPDFMQIEEIERAGPSSSD